MHLVQALMQNATEAMRESRVTDILNAVRHPLYWKSMSHLIDHYQMHKKIILEIIKDAFVMPFNVAFSFY